LIVGGGRLRKGKGAAFAGYQLFYSFLLRSEGVLTRLEAQQIEGREGGLLERSRTKSGIDLPANRGRRLRGAYLPLMRVSSETSVLKQLGIETFPFFPRTPRQVQAVTETYRGGGLRTASGEAFFFTLSGEVRTDERGSASPF